MNELEKITSSTHSFKELEEVRLALKSSSVCNETLKDYLTAEYHRLINKAKFSNNDALKLQVFNYIEILTMLLKKLFEPLEIKEENRNGKTTQI